MEHNKTREQELEEAYRAGIAYAEGTKNGAERYLMGFNAGRIAGIEDSLKELDLKFHAQDKETDATAGLITDVYNGYCLPELEKRLNRLLPKEQNHG